MFYAKRLATDFWLVPGLPESSRFHLEQLLGNVSDNACDAHKVEGLGCVSKRTTLKHAVVTFMRHNDDQLPYYRDLDTKAATDCSDSIQDRGVTSTCAEILSPVPRYILMQCRQNASTVAPVMLKLVCSRHLDTTEPPRFERVKLLRKDHSQEPANTQQQPAEGEDANSLHDDGQNNGPNI